MNYDLAIIILIILYGISLFGHIWAALIIARKRQDLLFMRRLVKNQDALIAVYKEREEKYVSLLNDYTILESKYSIFFDGYKNIKDALKCEEDQEIFLTEFLYLMKKIAKVGAEDVIDLTTVLEGEKKDELATDSTDDESICTEE